MKSSLNFSFSKVSSPRLQRSVFNRTCKHKTTIDEGWLVPIFIDEVLPGDTINMHATVMARLSTLEVPVMDNMYLDMHWWFCPNRLLWENWETFISGYSGRGEIEDLEIPQMTSDSTPNVITIPPFSLGDYFGLPVSQTWNNDDYGVSALPWRMYNLVWNEWYRDQNLQDEAVVDLDDGPDAIESYVLRKRNKRPDYFSTCLPWPQKGDAVLMPLGTSAPVIGDGQTLGLTMGGTWTGAPYSEGASGDMFFGTNGYGQTAGTAYGGGAAPAQQRYMGVTTDPTKSGLLADLTAAAAPAINNIRLAVAMQQVLERDARGGTRYTEHLVNHWGVTAEDYRLQRPEYLGGSSDPMGVHQVPQTSASEAGNPQAQLAAYGQMVSSSRFVKSFVEHGFVMCLVNFRADQTYQEGIRRMWSRMTRWEHFLPDLAHLGEQPVKVGELTLNTENPSYNQVFGYQERWAEYRYMNNLVTGAFRTVYDQSLDYWHLALDFIGSGTGLPELNTTFMQDNPPIVRILAVDNSEVNEKTHVIIDAYFSNKHARPLPVFSNPGLMRF